MYSVTSGSEEMTESTPGGVLPIFFGIVFILERHTVCRSFKLWLLNERREIQCRLPIVVVRRRRKEEKQNRGRWQHCFYIFAKSKDRRRFSEIKRHSNGEMYH